MPLCLLHQKFLRLSQSKLYLHNQNFHNLEMSAYPELPRNDDDDDDGDDDDVMMMMMTIVCW